MKVVAKGLSITFLICICSTLLTGQSSFVTKKKYELTKPSYTFTIDSSLVKYQRSVPMIYDFEKLAVFCKFEEKVARNSNLNMRFRLGSLDYVNYLEQKPNWQLSQSNTK
jgi:hypothetical protein